MCSKDKIFSTKYKEDKIFSNVNFIAQDPVTWAHSRYDK